MEEKGRDQCLRQYSFGPGPAGPASSATGPAGSTAGSVVRQGGGRSTDSRTTGRRPASLLAAWRTPCRLAAVVLALSFGADLAQAAATVEAGINRRSGESLACTRCRREGKSFPRRHRGSQEEVGGRLQRGKGSPSVGRVGRGVSRGKGREMERAEGLAGEVMTKREQRRHRARHQMQKGHLRCGQRWCGAPGGSGARCVKSELRKDRKGMGGASSTWMKRKTTQRTACLSAGVCPASGAARGHPTAGRSRGREGQAG